MSCYILCSDFARLARAIYKLALPGDFCLLQSLYYTADVEMDSPSGSPKGRIETEYDNEKSREKDAVRGTSIVTEEGEIVNASGHRDQLKRHYGLVSICGLALIVDNPWTALGTSIQVSIGMWQSRHCLGVKY